MSSQLYEYFMRYMIILVRCNQQTYQLRNSKRKIKSFIKKGTFENVITLSKHNFCCWVYEY